MKLTSFNRRKQANILYIGLPFTDITSASWKWKLTRHTDDLDTGRGVYPSGVLSVHAQAPGPCPSPMSSPDGATHSRS